MITIKPSRILQSKYWFIKKDHLLENFIARIMVNFKILCTTSRLTDLPIAIDLPAFRTVHAMANTSQRLTEW